MCKALGGTRPQAKVKPAYGQRVGAVAFAVPLHRTSRRGFISLARHYTELVAQGMFTNICLQLE